MKNRQNLTTKPVCPTKSVSHSQNHFFKLCFHIDILKAESVAAPILPVPKNFHVENFW